jgi:hypothetical protein
MDALQARKFHRASDRAHEACGRVCAVRTVRIGLRFGAVAMQRLDRAIAILPVLLVAGCRHGGDGAVDSANECPASWLEAPAVDPSIAVPSGGAKLLFHAAAVGFVRYVCRSPPDDPSGTGPMAWRSFLPPEASLIDCKGAVVGRLFRNEETGLPEWQLTSGAYVVAHEEASWPQRDAIGWQLLATENTLPYDAGTIAYLPVTGAHGPFGETRYVQRVHTTGGLPPTDPCYRLSYVDRHDIPFTADYYFYGP